MYGFQHFLQSTLVLVALASDYLLVLDLWIITPSAWPRILTVPRSTWRNRRWLSALRTTVVYAILEPVCYAIMTSTSEVPPAFLSVTPFHMGAVTCAIALIVHGAKEISLVHEEKCGGVDASDKFRRLYMGKKDGDEEFKDDLKAVEREGSGFEEDAGLLSNQEDSATGEKEDRDEIHQSTVPTSAPSDAKIAPSLSDTEAQNGEKNKVAAVGPNCPHSAPLKFILASLLPVTTAAASNAALMYYARYLDSQDSLDWIDRFAFGWTMIALLTMFCVGASKSTNIWLGEFTARRVLDFGKRENWPLEILTRASCLLVLLSVRGIQRILLNQHPIAYMAVNSDSSALIVLSDVKLVFNSANASEISGNATLPAGQLTTPTPALEPIFPSLPPWISIVWSIVTVVVVFTPTVRLHIRERGR